jgi:hypothetical protein
MVLDGTEAYHPDCVEQTVTYPVSHMIWNCITSRLKFVSGTVNTHRYTIFWKNTWNLSLGTTFSIGFYVSKKWLKCKHLAAEKVTILQLRVHVSKVWFSALYLNRILLQLKIMWETNHISVRHMIFVHCYVKVNWNYFLIDCQKGGYLLELQVTASVCIYIPFILFSVF